MAQLMKCSFDWQMDINCKEVKSDQPGQVIAGKRIATNDQLVADAKSAMTQQTLKTFADEMAKKGVYDYKFRSVNTTAKMVGTPFFFRSPNYAFAIVGGVIARVSGTTVIEFEDIPVAIVAIAYAIAAAIVANAGLIVVLGLIAIAAIITVSVLHVVVTDVSGAITATGDAVKTATSTTGGSVFVILAAIAAIIIGIIALVKVVPWLSNKIKNRGSGGMKY